MKWGEKLEQMIEQKMSEIIEKLMADYDDQVGQCGEQALVGYLAS